jgi:hypothetical protein
MYLFYTLTVLGRRVNNSDILAIGVTGFSPDFVAVLS